MPNDSNNTAGSDCQERLVRPLSDTPLHARLEDDQLVIRIGIDRLDGHDCHPDFPELPIRDRHQWARDVLNELERDRGDGATPLCLMLDEAMKEALEMGSSAIDYKRPTTRDEDGEPCLANVEWWHRRDQAPIQLGTLSPVATHDLIGTLLLDR